jgi:hypothetical protein
MKSRNLCLTAVVAALSLPVLAAEPVSQSLPSAAMGASAGDERVGFQTLDENQDGFLSREEARGTYLEKRFDALDADHDGRLSPSEVDAATSAAAGAR